MPTTNIATLGDGCTATINTTGANFNWFQITNISPDKSATINFLNNSDAVVWTFTQPPNSTSAQVPIPTIDNIGNPIVYQIAQVTSRGTTSQMLVSPRWNIQSV